MAEQIVKGIVAKIPEGYYKPSGKKIIRTTEELNVRDYATAQVYEPNLIPENIAKDVNVLGVVGTHEGGAGGIIPSGTIDISENGTYDVTEYESANVNVEGSGGVNTSDATATASDIMVGKTAYVNDEKIVGTIEVYDGSASGEYEPAPNKLKQLFNKTIVEVTKDELQGVTEIRPEFFYGCRLLEKVELVDTIKTIGQEAFANCTSLKEINIPEGVTTIPTFTFRNCTSLEKVTFPSTLTSVGAGAFELNTATKEMHITDLEKYIYIDFGDAGSNPLYSSESTPRAIYLNGEKLVNVTITKDIKKYAFIKADSIETLNVVNGVKTIGRYSCYNMKNLKNVFLPNTLTSIDSTAFNNNYNMEFITLENGFNCAIVLSHSTLYSVETMVSMFNALATITTTKTLTLGSSNLKKLSTEQKAIATNKGWTLV